MAAVSLLLDPFARTALCKDAVGQVLGFLDHDDLARIESVSRFWRQCIDETNQWQKQCQRLLNSAPTDPVPYIQGCSSYKEILQTLRSRVYDETAYRHYLGAETEFASISSLKRFNESDPCNREKIIGKSYVWIYSPSHFTIPLDENFPFKLDKPDDPNDPEAPRLIEKTCGIFDCFRAMFGLEEKGLRVPNTINNLSVLFGRPKNGYPSKYAHISNFVSSQHGNKRIPRGLICMREDVFAMNQNFIQQQSRAAARGVIIAQLGHRILFNFLRHAETGIYPEGREPMTYALTSSLTVDLQGTAGSAHCGGGGDFGLRVGAFSHNVSLVSCGAAVALPEEGVGTGP